MNSITTPSPALQSLRRAPKLIVMALMALVVTLALPLQAQASSSTKGKSSSSKSTKNTPQSQSRNEDRVRGYRVDDDDHNDNDHHFGHHMGKHTHKNGVGHDEHCGGDDSGGGGGGGGGGEVLVPVDIANITGATLISTPGDSVTLTAVLNAGSGPVTYQWMKRNALGAYSEIPGANALTLTLSNTDEADTGEYWIVATNSLGSATSTSTQVIIESNIVIVNTTGDNLTVEIGATLHLTAELLAGNEPVTYQWWKKVGPGTEAPVPGATSLNLTIEDGQESHSGQYWIVATNSAGSASSTPTQVKVLEPGVPDV